MALIRKTFFNFTPVEGQYIDDMYASCIEHFGKMAADIEKEIACREKEGSVPLNAMFLADSYGRSMNINSSTIIWEESLYFNDDEVDEDSDDIWGALVTYAQNATGKHPVVSLEGVTPEKASKDIITLPDLKEARDRIIQLFGEGLFLDIKIVKIGNVEYYCYCIDKLGEK